MKRVKSGLLLVVVGGLRLRSRSVWKRGGVEDEDEDEDSNGSLGVRVSGLLGAAGVKEERRRLLSEEKDEERRSSG